MPERAAPPPTVSQRPVVLVFLLLAIVAGVPYLRAALAPPEGKSFVGFFFFVDDSYNYLSYVQQAQSGRLLFENKLVLEPHAPALVNVEWLTVGWLSALLGGSPLVAYQIFGLVASFFLYWAIDYWLRRCGLPNARRLPALLLVACGGGVGGIAHALGGLSLTDSLDLATGLFPIVERLMSPHFVAATALLLWALAALVEERLVPALMLGTVLALTRPYDFVFLVLIRAIGIAVTQPPRAWVPKALPLLGYLPAVGYDYWVFYRVPAFTTFHAVNELIFPPWWTFALALAPGALLAAGTFRWPPKDATRAWVLHLLSWLAVAAAVILAPPVHFALQFLTGMGVPLLLLAALGLWRLSPRALYGAAVAMSTTAVVAAALTFGLDPHWYASADGLGVVRALAPACQPGDLAVTAGATGLYVHGLTPCRAFTSHANEPGHAERVEAVRSFYAAATAPADRAAFLDRICARFVLLPLRATAAEFLGRAPQSKAAESGALAVYEWAAPPGCTPGRGVR